jgi:hypothetical protein
MNAISDTALGLISVPEAEMMTAVNRRQIRGWLLGYAQRRAVQRAGPILRSQHPLIDGELALGFLDLLEVAFLGQIVEAARRRGHAPQWKAIRKAAETARRRFGSEHPFALKRLHTDGRSIFAEAASETGDPGLYDLVADNYAILDVLSASFVASVEYDGDIPRLWRPSPLHDRIVADPRRARGRPVESRSGAPAEALFDAFRAEKGNAARVAAYFETDEEGVRQAVAFMLGVGRRVPA